jgi:GH15 family glucan-1,4-alpha-glucosidase
MSTASRRGARKATDGRQPSAPAKATDRPQSAAAPSPFTPIAKYGFLSDCHTGALIAPDGTIDWLCVPRFDSPSVFGALLDRGAGAFRFAPRFLPGEDKILRASVLAIADELTENGFVLRYRTDETDDGMSGKEGTFIICSFWLVSALAIIGQMQRARDLMERLVNIASPLGLYAEEFDAKTGRHLGNFPQAFSHLAAVEAAARIVLADRIAEIP